VPQADQVEQPGQGGAGVAQLHRVAGPSRGQAQPGQVVDHGEIGAARTGQRPTRQLDSAVDDRHGRLAVHAYRDGRRPGK